MSYTKSSFCALQQFLMSVPHYELQNDDILIIISASFIPGILLIKEHLPFIYYLVSLWYSLYKEKQINSLYFIYQYHYELMNSNIFDVFQFVILNPYISVVPSLAWFHFKSTIVWIRISLDESGSFRFVFSFPNSCCIIPG